MQVDAHATCVTLKVTLTSSSRSPTTGMLLLPSNTPLAFDTALRRIIAKPTNNHRVRVCTQCAQARTPVQTYRPACLPSYSRGSQQRDCQLFICTTTASEACMLSPQKFTPFPKLPCIRIMPQAPSQPSRQGPLSRMPAAMSCCRVLPTPACSPLPLHCGP